MKILGFNITWGAKESQSSAPTSVVYQGVDEIGSMGHRYPIVDKYYDGEKNLGELGVVTRIVPDYKKLRLRMYSAYATIDTIKIIASKFFYWTIGSGLKLQAEPDRIVLESEGIKNAPEVYSKFQKITEARFKIYANSKQADYKKKSSLHDLALETYQGEFLGGDMLCIVRFEENGPNMQVVSGEHLCDPDLADYAEALAKSGNEIKHGIELDDKGAHVAFYVRTCKKDKTDTWERIPAVGQKSGKTMAWLVSGKKISPDHIRSVPQMSQSLEKVNKLDRYTEATVTKAEQGAKIVHTIEHQDFSTGEDPLKQKIAKVRGEHLTSIDAVGNRVIADGLANRMNETAPGMTYNMPNGAKLTSFQSRAEDDYAQFKKAVFEEVSAGSDVPPEVAMQQYNSNYSASRAAINSFGYIIEVNRIKFANDFYVPFYKLWLEFQILSNKISAPGYLENIDNFMVTESYSQCRFTGKNMPHIDPLKEIKAIREMLGIDGATPLISREQATEMLGAGQWDENFMKNLEEENLIPKEEVAVEENINKE